MGCPRGIFVCSSFSASGWQRTDSSESYLRVVKKDLVKALSEIGQADILVKGYGKLGIIREKIKCDYFEYLDGNPNALNLYKGRYMTQYAWAKGMQIDK